MNTELHMQKTFTLGIVGGLIAGIVLAGALVAYATWSDPSSAPPTGGYLKVNTTGGTPACTASDGGRLHYNDSTGVLSVCDGVATTWDALN